MNLKQAKEALAEYEATHGYRYHIFIAPQEGNWSMYTHEVITEQVPMPESIIAGRSDLDLVFVERSRIRYVRDHGGPWLHKYLMNGAPEP